MESNERLHQALRDAERGESAGWTGYRFPVWLPVAMAVWAGTLTAGLYYVDGTLGRVWGLIHVVVALAYAAWDRRTQAAYPTSAMPPEHQRPLLLLCLAPLALIPAAVFVGYYLAGWVAALLVALGWGAATWAYNTAYARASAAVRERLA